ncbi:MAG: cold-shock protein [bacterium]
MQEGEVKWFDDQKGFGFVEQDVGEDLFVHYSDIEQEGYKTLNEGDVVQFEIEETEKGLAAKQVEVTDAAEGSQDDDGGDEDLTDFDTDTLENSMSNSGSETQL